MLSPLNTSKTTQKKPEKGSEEDLGCSSLTFLDLLVSPPSALNYHPAEDQALVWKKFIVASRRGWTEEGGGEEGGGSW